MSIYTCTQYEYLITCTTDLVWVAAAESPSSPCREQDSPSAWQPHTMYVHTCKIMHAFILFFHTVWADIIHVHMNVHKEVKEHPPKEQNGANIREELWVQQEN